MNFFVNLGARQRATAFSSVHPRPLHAWCLVLANATCRTTVLGRLPPAHFAGRTHARHASSARCAIPYSIRAKPGAPLIDKKPSPCHEFRHSASPSPTLGLQAMAFRYTASMARPSLLPRGRLPSRLSSTQSFSILSSAPRGSASRRPATSSLLPSRCQPALVVRRTLFIQTEPTPNADVRIIPTCVRILLNSHVRLSSSSLDRASCPRISNPPFLNTCRRAPPSHHHTPPRWPHSS